MKAPRLMHGDCLEKMDLLISEGVKVDAIITDPPFNIVEKIGKNLHLFRQGATAQDSSMTEESMAFDVGFDQFAWLSRVKKLLKAGGNLIIFNDWENMGDIAKSLRASGIKIKSLNHWQKSNPMPAEWRRRFVSGREYFLHGTNGGCNTFNVEKLHKGVLEYALTKQSEKKLGKHPNQKPIGLLAELVTILTDEGDTVLDPFMGSGSTGMACRALGRDFVGVELNASFMDLTTARILWS